MVLDFGKLGIKNAVDTVLVPSEIFSALPNKNKKYQYLRDVQGEVLSTWYENCKKQDITIKMNTGSGKTLVGLLLLKSCLNAGAKPAVYIAPDPYLVKQVTNEARELGIDVTEDPKSLKFLRGQAILVINIYKILNGKSVFGVGENIEIPIGSLIVDDAHACLITAETQFCIKIKEEEVYKQILNLFYDELKLQSETGALEVESCYPGKNMLVPFWAWNNRQKEITEILFKHKDEEELKFNWPLLKNYLNLCQCVIGEGEIEISTRCLPVDSIPSFVNAKRRIFMTATLSDDSILVSDFKVSPDSVISPITPKNANDIGDRLILIPQEINPEISDQELKKFLKNSSIKNNIVVIVPSNYRSRFWEDVADMVLTSQNLHEGIEKLKNGHVGLVVLVNKYDGIDLPGDACRILVLDGIPDVRRKIDKIDQSILSGSSEILTRQIQRIEQGMGRGIRSNDDYCAVFLMGSNLIRTLFIENAIALFTNATKAQIDLSFKVAEQVQGKELSDIQEVLDMFLNRDPRWVAASKSALAQIKYNTEGVLSDSVVAQRVAFDAAQIKDFGTSIKALQKIIDGSD